MNTGFVNFDHACWRIRSQCRSLTHRFFLSVNTSNVRQRVVDYGDGPWSRPATSPRSGTFAADRNRPDVTRARFFGVTPECGSRRSVRCARIEIPVTQYLMQPLEVVQEREKKWVQGGRFRAAWTSRPMFSGDGFFRSQRVLSSPECFGVKVRQLWLGAASAAHKRQSGAILKRATRSSSTARRGAALGESAFGPLRVNLGSEPMLCACSATSRAIPTDSSLKAARRTTARRWPARRRAAFVPSSPIAPPRPRQVVPTHRHVAGGAGALDGRHDDVRRVGYDVLAGRAEAELTLGRSAVRGGLV
jgi:hypothetical protein